MPHFYPPDIAEIVCPECEHFAASSGVCTYLHENVRNYPEKFSQKCNGQYFHGMNDVTLLELLATADPETENEAASDLLMPEIGTNPSPESDHLARQAVLAELEKSTGPRQSRYQNVLVLLISALLFIGLGSIRETLIDIIFIALVILLHEAGHLIAMKIFGYQDVQIFFIPLVGAATKGTGFNATGAQKALVALAGPVPGILIGLALGVFYFMTRQAIVGTAASAFLFINGINLLPVFPFDGGRFLNEVVFIRNRYLEFLFILMAGVLLISIGVFATEWFFGLLGVMVLLSLKNTFQVSTIAHDLKPRLVIEKGMTTLKDAPPDIITPIIDKINLVFVKFKPAEKAEFVRAVWEKMNARPPRLLSTIGMLCVYLIATFIGLIVFSVLSNPGPN